MAATVMKLESEQEPCCVCGGGGELLTPEEHDAIAPNAQAPLRTMLLHLTNNKVMPEGRLCGGCAARAADAYEFSSALSARAPAPLSEKIRALRRRLHQLTQKIDVFIVVGSGAGGAGGAAGAYSEDDIIMVEKEALASAAAADDDALEHARNAKGDTVYQCTVCPLSFQRVSEYRAHSALHGADARHSCWTCGAQFAAREELRAHAAEHRVPGAACHLCDTTFQTATELRRHEAACPARCPACALQCASRAELSAHCAAHHGPAAPAPSPGGRGPAPALVCAVCFRTFGGREALSAHALRHRQERQFVCGYADCVLRFATRNNLMSHIRKCHAAELPEPEPAAAALPDTTCAVCNRTFATVAAMKRHARVHRAPAAAAAAAAAPEPQEEVLEEMEVSGGEGVEYVLAEADGDEGEGEVEYLEVEALEDMEEYDVKPDLGALHG